MVKGERRRKREEIRRIVAEDERRRKEKEQKKSSPRKANYRKDKQGNIILFGNLKVSKLSMVVLVAIVGIGVFLYLMSLGVGEMEGYVEPDFSFEMCKKEGFAPDMCRYHYKFCRTYDDGKSICQFAETDPWKDITASENKWTEGEQDFLPSPSQFILPFAYGDEPVCYSSACKNTHPDLVGGMKKVDTNLTVKDARKLVSELEDDILTLEKKIREYEVDKDQWDLDLRRIDKQLEDGEETYEDEKTAYRHAFDVKPKTQADIDFQNTASINFKKAQQEWNSLKIKWENTHTEYDTNYELYYTALKDLKVLEDELEQAREEFDIAKVSNRIAQRGNNKFVNIILSDTCITMIENNFTTNCPTYRELRDRWDNTIPRVSGDWTETEFDVSRESSKYKQYWNYYKALPNWKIITVDPDNEIKQLGVNIIIHPRSFEYLEKADSTLKNESLNITSSERYVWHDFKYDKYCSTISIAPTDELLAKAINSAWDGCEITTGPEIIPMERTFFNAFESNWYQYTSWLSNALAECLDKC